jgi:general secretion pathway protein G
MAPVIAIGLAAIAAAPRAASPRVDTRDRLATLASRIEDYRAANGTLPSSADGAESATDDPMLLTDGWGREVVYIRIADGFWLLSWGADGAPGGEGDAADVVQIDR